MSRRRRIIKNLVFTAAIKVDVAMEVTICNPLCRTPLSLIIDDSCPVINKAYYWMARTLSHVRVQPTAEGHETYVQIDTKFPTANFTLSLGVAANRVRVNGGDLGKAQYARDFRSGCFRIDGRQTFAAFDLSEGRTAVEVAH